VVTVADMTSRLDDERSLAVDRTVDLTVDLTRARALAAAVPDPEIPVLTIDDLGVLRDVTLEDDGTVVVTITPTYSGCPAMDAIRADVLTALQDGGFQARVDLVLSPAWTTDWMSADGRRKLTEYGIAPPPTEAERRRGPVALTLGIHCPQCGSLDTEQLSRFGSTACKALWRCRACAEPFDHFKSL
jgi:ring-1,2-phenylacetyl-CoA epoxidase subunit PaaD